VGFLCSEDLTLYVLRIVVVREKAQLSVAIHSTSLFSTCQEA